MPKKSTHLARVRKSITRLNPVIKALRPSLALDAARLVDLATKGARALDWLARQKKRPTKVASRKQPSSSKPEVSHKPIPPGVRPERGKRKTSESPDSLAHIPAEIRDLARLELLRASHQGAATFHTKREELMERFGISKDPNRFRIMGAFWSHLSGNRRAAFVTRILAMKSFSGKKRDMILSELAKLYRTPRAALVREDASAKAAHH